MINNGRIVRLTRMWSIRCYECGEERRGEGCLVIYDLVTSLKAEKRNVNAGDAWFRVLPISVSFSVSELEFWSAGIVCLLSAGDKFVFYNFSVFRSDQIGFSLLFTPKVTD